MTSTSSVAASSRNGSRRYSETTPVIRHAGRVTSHTLASARARDCRALLRRSRVLPIIAAMLGRFVGRRRAPARATSPSLERVTGAVAQLPYMTPEQGHRIYNHVRATRPLAALELGTGHGVSAAYIAAGL